MLYPITAADKDWSPSQATWNEKRKGDAWSGGPGGGEAGDGTYGPDALGTAKVGNNQHRVAFDLPASLVEQWISDSNPGVMLLMNQKNGGLGICAAEWGPEKGPRLNIQYVATEADE